LDLGLGFVIGLEINKSRVCGGDEDFGYDSKFDVEQKEKIMIYENWEKSKKLGLHT